MLENPVKYGAYAIIIAFLTTLSALVANSLWPLIERAIVKANVDWGFIGVAVGFTVIVGTLLTVTYLARRWLGGMWKRLWGIVTDSKSIISIAFGIQLGVIIFLYFSGVDQRVVISIGCVIMATSLLFLVVFRMLDEGISDLLAISNILNKEILDLRKQRVKDAALLYTSDLKGLFKAHDPNKVNRKGGQVLREAYALLTKKEMDELWKRCNLDESFFNSLE